ncbi:MAG: DUF1285 domain-containing protein [Deltaproteobacteria bacterium]|nr:DUF1285 domain-containing protein [Deltaproteobacteria bacterium]MBF0524311.1 DUF1285 domain-containing protein [Deltaproteobacteria bacterium]
MVTREQKDLVTLADPGSRTYKYRIDSDGLWFCEGNPVTDEHLLSTLSSSMFYRGEELFLRCEGEVHQVIPDDAPLVVRSLGITENGTGEPAAVILILNDRRRMPLLPETLTISRANVLYCLSTPKKFRTRFSKQAYYHLTRYLKQDPETGDFFFLIHGRPHIIRQEE